MIRFALMLLALPLSAYASAEAYFPRVLKTSKCVRSEWRDVVRVQASVAQVVDGDTVKVEIEGLLYNVRLLSIDTPETNYQGKSQGYWAEKAKGRLAKLLPRDKRVTVDLGDEKCDRYGRILGYVVTDRGNINVQMVREALAVNYCIAPTLLHCEELARLTERNVRAGKGIYGAPEVELPYEWRRRVSGRPHEKYVGDIETLEVYGPGSLERVPIGNRVFFMSEKDIRPPFQLAE